MKPIIAVLAIAALLHRAYSRKSLTPLGIAVAALTAVIHALHPSSLPFALLGVFFLGGTAATKVKHDVKARLTLSASGESGGEGARTHVQVLASSGVASVLILLHLLQLYKGNVKECWGRKGDLLVVGIVANYASVAADTFSSELGILSPSKPRLLTSLSLREVPPGTNGGVTPTGLLAGLLGAFTIASTSALLLPFGGENGLRTWSWNQRLAFMTVVTVWGGMGSVLDSVLGGWLQASVVDTRTGKVVEGVGGKRVLITSSLGRKSAQSSSTATGMEKLDGASERRGKSEIEPEKEARHQPGRVLGDGRDVLDNNAVNLLMAGIMSAGGMVVAGWYWGVPLTSILS